MRLKTRRQVWASQLHGLIIPHFFIKTCLPCYNREWIIFPKFVFILGYFKLECIPRAQKAQNNDSAFWFLKSRSLCAPCNSFYLEVIFPVFL